MSGGLTARAFLALLRLFYPQIAVRGAFPPGAAGVIVVANHANGLLDPLVVRLAAGRPVAFLAKSTLFGIPVLRSWLSAFEAIPVFRAKESDTSQNERTFALARERLGAGGWLALFPEGISHDEPRLTPLKTGAARIALGVEGDVLVVPVGLVYEAKDTFRSRVSATVGEAIDPGSFRAQARQDERAAVRSLTTRIAEALGEVVLQAEDAGLWQGFVTVASWLVGDSDVGARDAKARELAVGWRRLAASDRQAVESIAEEARAFARELAQLGLASPLAVEPGCADALQATGKMLPLVPLAPLALVGALLGWLPYRIIRPVAVRLAKGEHDVVSTYKLLLGLLVMPAWWLLEAAGLAAWGGWLVGFTALALGPLCGYVALVWDERVSARRALLRAGWLVATRARVASRVAERRRTLAARIETALATTHTGDAT